MKHPRTFALVAAAFLLYILVSVGALGTRLSIGVVLVALVALWSALFPLLRRSTPTDEAGRFVLLMGSLTGLSLGAWLALDAGAQFGELLVAVTVPPLGLVSLRLALAFPDVPPRLARHLYAAYPARWLSAAASVLGVCASLPPIWLFERAWIAPHWFARAPLAFALACAVTAFGLRLLRRSLGSSTRALSENLWPLLGSAFALLVLCVCLGLTAFGLLNESLLRACMAIAAFAFVIGHLWLVSPTRALSASPWARRAVASAFALGWVLLFVWLAARHNEYAASLPVPLAGAAVLAYLLFRPFSERVSRFLFAPQRGVLLSAITKIEGEVSGATSYAELAGRILRALRRASDSPEAAPLLFSFAPDDEVRLDAAGQPRRVSRALKGPIARHLQEYPGESIVRDDLRARLVRRPELRELVVALDELDALCVVPLVVEGELEGALVIARGARTDALTMEELEALYRLSSFVGPLLVQFLSRERAIRRADETGLMRDALRAELDEAREELVRLQAETNLLRAGHAPGGPPSTLVHYSPLMRDFVDALVSLAAQDIPILLDCEQGVPLRPFAELIRAHSGRADKPLVVGDCAALAADDQQVALFGTSGESTAGGRVNRPGWLELAADGVLLLTDVAALSQEVQAELAVALSDKRARRLGAQGAFPVTARVILSARSPVQNLMASGAFAPELARWVKNGSLEVPTLRACREDLESLVLLSMDKAARVLGRDVPGIAPDALQALADYDFPGNQYELESVMERALAISHGTRVSLEDLPPLPVGAMRSGSFVDQEREILRRALERAGGNKSRAARALGLKRATLIDKLKLLGLEGQGQRDTEH